MLDVKPRHSHKGRKPRDLRIPRLDAVVYDAWGRLHTAAVEEATAHAISYEQGMARYISTQEGEVLWQAAGGDTQNVRRNPETGAIRLSPPLRRLVADIHARIVFDRYVKDSYAKAPLSEIARGLTHAGVLAPRGGRKWGEMRTYHMLARVERAS